MAAIALICKLVYRIVPYEPLIDSRMPSSLDVGVILWQSRLLILRSLALH